jgi:hypothetical protein
MVIVSSGVPAFAALALIPQNGLPLYGTCTTKVLSLYREDPLLVLYTGPIGGDDCLFYLADSVTLQEESLCCKKNTCISSYKPRRCYCFVILFHHLSY